jgi:ATP-dependent Clp protease protease subunit
MTEHLRPAARDVPPGASRRADAGPRAALPAERLVLLGAPLDDAAANDVVAQLVLLEQAAPDRDISLCINSPGGTFGAMTAVLDTMRFLSCDIGTVCVGRAASVAAGLLAAGTPGKRLALPGSRVVLCEPPPSEPLRGRPADLEVRAAEVLRERGLLQETIARCTGRPPERVRRDLERGAVLDAAAAVEYGLVDRLAARRPGAER